MAKDRKAGTSLANLSEALERRLLLTNVVSANLNVGHSATGDDSLGLATGSYTFVDVYPVAAYTASGGIGVEIKDFDSASSVDSDLYLDLGYSGSSLNSAFVNTYVNPVNDSLTSDFSGGVSVSNGLCSGSFSFANEFQQTLSGSFSNIAILGPDLSAGYTTQPIPNPISSAFAPGSSGTTMVSIGNQSVAPSATSTASLSFQLVPTNSSTNNGQVISLAATATASIDASNNVTPTPVTVNFTILPLLASERTRSSVL